MIPALHKMTILVPLFGNWSFGSRVPAEKKSSKILPSGAKGGRVGTTGKEMGHFCLLVNKNFPEKTVNLFTL